MRVHIAVAALAPGKKGSSPHLSLPLWQAFFGRVKGTDWTGIGVAGGQSHAAAIVRDGSSHGERGGSVLHVKVIVVGALYSAKEGSSSRLSPLVKRCNRGRRGPKGTAGTSVRIGLALGQFTTLLDRFLVEARRGGRVYADAPTPNASSGLGSWS